MKNFSTKRVMKKISEAGICDNVSIANVEYNSDNGRFGITVKTKNGMEYSTNVFRPDMEHSDSEKTYNVKLDGSIKRITEVVWAVCPDRPEIEGETWDEFCRMAVLKFRESRNKDVKCYAVLTYNKRGYLGLRGAYSIPNIERMVEGQPCTLKLLDTDLLRRPANAPYVAYGNA